MQNPACLGSEREAQLAALNENVPPACSGRNRRSRLGDDYSPLLESTVEGRSIAPPSTWTRRELWATRHHAVDEKSSLLLFVTERGGGGAACCTTDGRTQTRRREVQLRCTERRTVLGRVGRPGRYCPLVSEPHTVGPRVPGTLGPPCYHMTLPGAYSASVQHRAAREQGPGLRALFQAAVMLPSRATSPSVFSHVRSISPGHPDDLQVIRDKCWIATRARLAWPSRARGPQMADFQGPRGPGWPRSGPI